MSFNLSGIEENLEEQKGIKIIPEYYEILRLIEQRNSLIFVTGGAGTGKSTFIRWVMDKFKGKVLLGAPTAIAAINIGAKTLHSLCLLPPTWILDEDIRTLYRKKEVKNAKILIIDEISMVNPNLLDGVDKFFRLNRGVNKPFGGLVTIMVGDLYQLPPVVTKSSKELFTRFYDTHRFYSAGCFSDIPLNVIELDRVFRQSDNEFISLLSDIRKGVNIRKAVKKLNATCVITDNPGKGAVRLCPRNAEVTRYNMDKLYELSTPIRVYEGEIKGKFMSKELPSPMELTVKVGAQVMFTQNSPDKLWINGTVGVITTLKDDIIVVELEDTGDSVEVTRASWANYSYEWNEALKEIVRVEIGSYEQFPLILAWAITIHKSQGKTIEHVHLDLGAGAFETGQTYVALSRCPTMQGITLSREIDEDDVIVDVEIADFYGQLTE